MSAKPVTAHSVQLFILAKGGLAQGPVVDCKSPADACRIAEERVRLGGALGAGAFPRTVVEPVFVVGSEAITGALFGKVPPGLTEQLPF